MQAVGSFVAIKKSKGVVRKSKCGLDIPSDIEDRFIQGVIISVSDQGKEEFGLKKDDVVLYDKHSFAPFKGVDGEDYVAVHCKNIAVVL